MKVKHALTASAVLPILMVQPLAAHADTISNDESGTNDMMVAHILDESEDSDDGDIDAPVDDEELPPTPSDPPGEEPPTPTDPPSEEPPTPTEPPVETTEPPVETPDPPSEEPPTPTEPPVDPTTPPVEPTEPPVDSTTPPVRPTDPTVPPAGPTEPPMQPRVPELVPEPGQNEVQPAIPGDVRAPGAIGMTTVGGQFGAWISQNLETGATTTASESASVESTQTLPLTGATSAAMVGGGASAITAGGLLLWIKRKMGVRDAS